MFKNSSYMLAFIVVAVVAVFAEAADKPTRPNVLFIASDDLNTDLGCYDHALVKSPHIDRLAARGMRFERAYCQYPVCNPSRSSFMTGTYPDETGVLNNKDRFRRKQGDIITLPQLFMQHGYFAARVGKIYHYNVPDQIGDDGLDDPGSWNQVVNPRGIDREVHDQIHTLQKGKFGGTLSWLKLDSEDSEHTDAIGATAAIRLLEQHHPKKTGKPFFLAVGFYRPHTPYVAPTHYFDLYPTDKIKPQLEIPGDRDDIPLAALADRPKQRELSLAKRKEIIQAYYASVSLMDAQVGRLLDAVDRLELANNTIIVFVSDHGYHLGHHGLWQKGDLFEGSAHVPLIIATPDMKTGGAKTAAITELVDLYPTLADLCGLPKPDHLSGTSLTPVLKNPQHAGKESALTEARSRGGNLHREIRGKKILGYSIRTPQYRYTMWNDGEYGEELYDYEGDPMEITNLAEKNEHAATMAKMRKLMKSAKKRGQ